MINILNKINQPLRSLKKFAVLSVTILTLSISLLLPTTARAQVPPVPIDGTTTNQVSYTDKIACKQYAIMIKNLITKIKLMMEEKTKYFETQIALLYTQAEAAFLAGDIDAYDAIMSQITALEALYNQMMTAFNQVLTLLNQALIEASKNPCKIQTVKDLIKKALGNYKEAKILCDKLNEALAMIK